MKRLLYLSLVIFFSACSQPKNNAVTQVDIDGEPLSIIQYDKIQDTSRISLSQIVEDLKIIPLETKEECLFSSARYYAYHKYILVIERNKRIMQFTSDGKFIRQICRYGQGPREFQSPVIAVNETKGILFLGDANKSYIMAWDLNTGEFIKEIPRPYKGKLKRIHFTKTGTLLVAPIVGNDEAGKYYLWEQDLDGNIISEIKAPATESWVDSDQDVLLYFNGEGYNYLPIHEDTIYRITNNELTPSWTIDLGRNNDKLNNQVGHRSFTYGFESNRFFFGKVYTLEKVEMIKYEGGVGYTTNGKSEIILVDKKLKKVYLNENIFNDLIAKDISYYYFKIQSNQQITIQYQAVDLIEQAEIVLEDPKTDRKIKTRLEKILSTIDIEDNPILIIGTLKN